MWCTDPARHASLLRMANTLRTDAGTSLAVSLFCDIRVHRNAGYNGVALFI